MLKLIAVLFRNTIEMGWKMGLPLEKPSVILAGERQIEFQSKKVEWDRFMFERSEGSRQKPACNVTMGTCHRFEINLVEHPFGGHAGIERAERRTRNVIAEIVSYSNALRQQQRERKRDRIMTF